MRVLHTFSSHQVFCTDCNQLTLDVMAHRGLNSHTCNVHIGLDGGQGMLKVALTITDRLGIEKSDRASYSEVIINFVLPNSNKSLVLLQGVAPRQAKYSSVKKLILLAVVPDAPENYFNVRTILTQLEIEVLEFTVSADVKMCKFFFSSVIFLTNFPQ